MSAFNELIKTESFLKMATTVVFWLALYILVKLFTIRAGAGDLLRMGQKKIFKLRKLTRQFRLLCTSRGAYKNLSRSVKLLRKVIRCEKKASRLLTIYLFDDREDFDVAGSKKLVSRIPDVCREALVSISEKKGESLVPLFDQADADLKEAIALLKKAADLDRKKELLQIDE